MLTHSREGCLFSKSQTQFIRITYIDDYCRHSTMLLCEHNNTKQRKYMSN